VVHGSYESNFYTCYISYVNYIQNENIVKMFIKEFRLVTAMHRNGPLPQVLLLVYSYDYYYYNDYLLTNGNTTTASVTTDNDDDEGRDVGQREKEKGRRMRLETACTRFEPQVRSFSYFLNFTNVNLNIHKGTTYNKRRTTTGPSTER
jgi:hypothetical protein